MYDVLDEMAQSKAWKINCKTFVIRYIIDIICPNL